MGDSARPLREIIGDVAVVSTNVMMLTVPSRESEFRQVMNTINPMAERLADRPSLFDELDDEFEFWRYQSIMELGRSRIEIASKKAELRSLQADLTDVRIAQAIFTLLGLILILFKDAPVSARKIQGHA